MVKWYAKCSLYKMRLYWKLVDCTSMVIVCIMTVIIWYLLIMWDLIVFGYLHGIHNLLSDVLVFEQHYGVGWYKLIGTICLRCFAHGQYLVPCSSGIVGDYRTLRIWIQGISECDGFFSELVYLLTCYIGFLKWTNIYDYYCRCYVRSISCPG